MQANQDHLLTIENLSVNFKTDEGIVSGIEKLHLQIPNGKTLGLVGESGSGKSVTALSIMGLLPSPPSQIPEGKIIFEGRDLLTLNGREMRNIRGNKISMIFQEPMTSLNPVFTLGNQVDETLILHQKLSKREAREKTLELFAEMGLPRPSHLVNSYPHQISGGQKQRVMIAIAMACNPQLLICDEPTTALDVTIQKQVLELMLALQEKHKMSMLFITHDLAIVAEIAHEVAVMYKGKLVEKNTSRQIFQNPQHPYTQGLLACRPRLDKNPRRLPTVEDFFNKDKRSLEKNQTKIPTPYDPIKNPVLWQIKNFKTYFPIKGGLLGRTQSLVKAVDDINLEIRKGRTLGLVGESGCGKTTFGRSLIRLIEPSEGEVFYQGENILTLSNEQLRQLRKKIQIIFQDPYASLNPRMTIGEAIIEPMLIHKIFPTRGQMVQKGLEMLQKVGLGPDHFNRYPHEFSGGQRQRVCIARALVLNPEFIICDESVSALDVSVQAQVLNLLQDLQEEFHLTYLFISHDLSVVKYMADEIGVMKAGKIVELSTAEEIYNHPKNDYTKELLSAIPKGQL